MADQPSHRRRFQFRLRTLLIGVTLFALIPCGYLGWQAKIVKQRRTAASELTQYGAISWASEFTALPPGISLKKLSVEMVYRRPLPQVSWLRRLLGDDYAVSVLYSPRIPDESLDRIKAAFPETIFVKLSR